MNEYIVHALTSWSVSAQPKLWVAAHEIGHALTFLAHGLRPDWVRLDFEFLGGLQGGTCHIDPPDPATPPEQVRGWLIGALAGHAAKTRFGRLYFHLDDDHAHQWGAQGADSDYDEFHRLRTTFRVQLSEDAAFHHATATLERHARRLDWLTWRLARARQLTGSAL